MYYKMYKKGLKVLTSFDTGIVHLDAGSTMGQNKERTLKLVYSEYRNKLIYWHRFIYLPDKSLLLRLWDVISIGYAYVVQTFKYALKSMLSKKDEANAFFGGIKDALKFLKSQEYRQLPRI